MRTKEERRLDSIARFLERNHLCAAVAVFDGKLLYTTNSIYSGATARESSKASTAEKTQKALELITKETFDRDGEDGDLFTQIVLENVKAVVQQGIMILDDNKIKLITRSFLAEDGITQWQNKTIQQLSAEYKTAVELSNAVLVGSIAERLATDLLKARQEFQNDGDENSLLKRGLAVELVTAKKKGVHAEMTLLDRMIEISDEKNSQLTGVYIGISKKCCANCTKVVEAVNTALPTVTITIDDSEEKLNESADLDVSRETAAADLSFTSVEISPIKVSGSHSQKPKTWKKPDFLIRTTSEKCQLIQKSYEEIIKTAAAENDEENSRYDMVMARSPSPPPPPSSVFEPIDPAVENIVGGVQNITGLERK